MSLHWGTEGTSWLHSEYKQEPWAVEALAKVHRMGGDPERSR